MKYIALILVCCSHLLTVSAGSISDSIPELPLPKVPATLREPSVRATYIIEHFWDEMDFRDTLRSHNREFMEQNFSNFMSVFPYADEQAQRTAIATLLHKAEADNSAYIVLRDIAEKYLYEPNSPMLSEEYYILFLEHFVQSPILGTTTTNRLRWQLEAARKNRPGMTAADFVYTTRNGNKTTLHKTASEGEILLIFYDPDCEHCKEIMGELQTDKTLADMVASGRIKVLAINSGDDYNLWKSTADSLPANWIVGYESGELQENGSYVLRAMPTLYLLDSNKKVVLKDVPPAQLFSLLRSYATLSAY
ncbi:MAG: DUF5106 domain-containing protein [Prevotella sp.]|nr:DUF5106 domain-containing protein [Prevotella sp.]